MASHTERFQTMILFYLLATALSAAAGFFDSFGVLETASAALLVCACVSTEKVKASRIALTYISSLVISMSSAVAIYYFTHSLPDLILPATLLSLSQVLQPYIVALPVIICLVNKKDPITTALFAISASAVFIIASNCLSVFISYDHFGFDAFEFYAADMNNAFMEMLEGQNVGILAQKVYVSFITRLSVSLLPGVCIMLAVVQVFVLIAVLKMILKERLKSFHKGPWAVSLSMVSAIVNILCIMAFMSCFFSSSVTTFTAVAGNIMLILAPASTILGFAFLMIGFHKGGFINLIFSALPILMLFWSPQIAIIYISFIGSANVIFARIAMAIFKIK